MIQIIPHGAGEPFTFIESGEFRIPEPGILSLFGFGLAGLGLFRRRAR